MNRYTVQTVSGYSGTSAAGSNARYGITAHVCDSLYLYEVVATYSNLDKDPVPGRPQRRLGSDGAISKAEKHAEKLNATRTSPYNPTEKERTGTKPGVQGTRP